MDVLDKDIAWKGMNFLRNSVLRLIPESNS